MNLRDEFEPAYRHCKPGTGKNYCGFKDGENISTLPVGTPYTKDSPAQTVIAELQRGGVDALQEGWYLTSTQYSAYNAFVQDFSDGHQNIHDKDLQFKVRAVRRFLIN